LKRSAVDEKYITVRLHKIGKPVQLPVHPEMSGALLKLKSGECFFWSGAGNPKSCVGDWQRTLRRLGEIAGVHVRAPLAAHVCYFSALEGRSGVRGRGDFRK
jgi:hypothetical protein